MGLFGNSSKATMSAKYDPSALSSSDKMMLFGAMLSDLGNRTGSQSISGVQQALAGRQQQARLLEANKALSGLFGGSAPQAAPDMSAPTPVVSPAMSFPSQGTGSPALNLPQINAPPPRPAAPQLPSISDPAVIQKLLAAKFAGADIGPALDILKANKAPDPHVAVGPDGTPYNQSDLASMAMRFRNPTNVNGHIVDLNNQANEGAYLPGLENGMTMGRNGEASAIPGYAQGMASIKGAQTAADAAIKSLHVGPDASAAAAATAPYQFTEVPDPSGAPRKLSNDRAAGGDFVGQTPADAARTSAATAAQISLPATIQQSQQALDLIDKMKTHPALDARTGWRSMIPAIPGTEGASFDAMADQLKGKMFMDAYAGLKGGGQITEVEGKKATDAMARLNTHQTKADYVQALDDLQGVIKAGAERAQRLAAQGVAPARTAPATPPVARPALEAELRRRGLIK